MASTHHSFIIASPRYHLPILFLALLIHSSQHCDKWQPSAPPYAAAFPTSLAYVDTSSTKRPHAFSQLSFWRSRISVKHRNGRIIKNSSMENIVFSLQAKNNDDQETSCSSTATTSTKINSTANNANRKRDKSKRSKNPTTKKNIPLSEITIYASPPIIDQEGRQWRSSEQLLSHNLCRDGLEQQQQQQQQQQQGHNNNVSQTSTIVGGSNGDGPFVATLEQHSLLLRSLTQGETPNLKKGRFVNDDERWLHRYDALCKFHERYGHTCVPFKWGTQKPKIMDIIVEENTISEPDIIRDDVEEEDTISFYDDEEDQDSLDFKFDEEEEEEDDNEFRDEATILDEESAHERSNNTNSSGILLSSEFTEPYLRLELGYWVAQQRHYYKQRMLGNNSSKGERLTPQRIEYLNQLNFIWDVKEARWETQYQRLKEYIKRNGHANVRQNSTLGHWIYKQRYHQRNIDKGVTVDWADIPKSAYKPLSAEEIENDPTVAVDRVIDTAAGGKEYRGRPVSPLTLERKAKLNEIGFIWDAREAAWDEKFQELVSYKKTHGTTRVPLSYGGLGVWVKKQREAWKASQQKKGSSSGTYALTPERIAKLDAIHFVWRGRDHTWDEHYQHLQRYIQQHNNADVPQTLNTDEYPKLGSWLSTQRVEGRKYESGDPSTTLTTERYELLKNAGVQFDPLLAQFLSRVEQLRIYQSNYGTLKVKSKHDKSLWTWVRRMTKEYESYLGKMNSKEERSGSKKHLLEDEVRRNMLDELGFREELLDPKR